MSVYAQLERGADDVGTAARGHHLIVCRHERRAHDARLFEAAAAAVALLQVADERAVLEHERELGLKWKLEWAREVFAQMIVDLVWAILKNFSRIKNVFRVEHALDFAHHA